MTTTNTCPRCRRPLPPDADYCPRCGLRRGARLRLRVTFLVLLATTFSTGFVLGAASRRELS